MTTNATETTQGSDYQLALREVVKDRMRRGNLTLADLALYAKMRSDYLGHCLRGKRPLSVETLNKLAGILGTTTEQLHREAKALCD